MTQKNKEVRYFDVELRAHDGEDGARFFEGHAASFGVESSVLYEWMDGEWVEFVEVIAREAFDDALAADDLDLIFNTQHNDNNMIARLNPKEGISTLTAEADDTGLFIRAAVPNTTHANDAYEHVMLGNLKRMSFAFRVDKAGEEWSKKDDGMLVRTITSFKKLYDVAIVRNPAYNKPNSTEINVAQRSEDIDLINRVYPEGPPEGLLSAEVEAKLAPVKPQCNRSRNFDFLKLKQNNNGKS